MKTKTISLFLLLVMTVCSAAINAKKVHTLGDSTMAPYDESATNTRGWGMYFGNFLTNGWTSVNYAKGGRDSRGGYNELWQNAKNNVEAGDYVLIQFGHNDEKYNGADNLELQDYYKTNSDATNAAAVKSDGRGTVPSTTYKACLKQIVDAVKAKGAIPVLVSPVCRCYFSGSTITRAGRHDLGDKFDVLVNGELKTAQKVGADDHTMDYPYHMKQLATELNVAFVDMTTATKTLYESYGTYDKCYAALFDKGSTTDNTHYNLTGALTAARLCASMMKEQGILSDNIEVPTDLSVSPSKADMGEGYLGQSAMKELTLSGLGLNPATGTVNITATEGIQLSVDKQDWRSELTVSYQNGTLIKTFYARVALTQAGMMNGTITAVLGSKTVEVPVTVNVIELGGGKPFTVKWPMTANDEPAVEGLATATAAKVEGMVKYSNNSQKGIMVSTSEGGTWVKAEDDSPNQYVQFTMTAPDGKKLDINHIAMKVGGHGGNGMMCHVYYSTDGFKTRTTIYSPTSMASGVMNEVEATPVIKLEEGEQLQIRVYPWYTSNATGKWLCVSDVLVGGQAKDAAGITIEDASINWPFVNEGMDAEYSSNELGATLASCSLTLGSMLKISGTRNMGGYMCNKVYNQSGSSLPSATTDGNTMTLTIRPDDGFTFLPDSILFGAARIGTSGGTLNVTAQAGDNEQTLATGWAPGSYSTAPYYNDFSAKINSMAATADHPLIIKIALCSLGNTKEIGFHDIKVTGTMSGAATSTTKYTLTPLVAPADAGSVSVDPDMNSFKEGTEVTLKATKAFGYQFKEWQDSTGTVLGTEAQLSVTMNADKTVKAVFEPMPVYTVTTKATNDIDRSLGSVVLSPNDHNGQYEAGTKISATASESKILKFMQWTDTHENAGTTATRTLTVNGDMELVAHYEVQDFVAVFDASKVNTYAYTTTANYPFAADLTWDDQREAKASIVKVSDGSLCYTKDGGTPVVRNRTSAVLSTINGLYQNGYRTTDIAWQYQFSTKGFTNVTFTADMAAKNGATKAWKAQLSLDGTTFIDIEGAAWTVTANVLCPVSFDLPATANGQETVYVRITGAGTETFNTTYAFDKEFNGLQYCDHSESGVGNVYVLGAAEVVADEEAPVAISLIPAKEATGVSATGRITVSYNERIQAGKTNGMPTLNGTELSAQWSSRSVSFDYFNLAYGQTYTFTMPEGFVEDKSGNKAAALTLTFTVMERQKPAARTFDAIVDQSLDTDKIAATATMPAQYKKIQDAINDAPAVNEKPYLIYIKEGYYNDPNETFNSSYGFVYTNPEDANSTETTQIAGGKSQYDDCRLVYVNKPNIHLIGQAVDKVTIAGDRLDGGAGWDRKRAWYHVNAGATLEIQAGADDFYAENITIDNENWTRLKKEGPQALSINTDADRLVFNNLNVRSYQDTYKANGTYKRAYWHNSTIEGAVDFIYGDCDIWFENTVLNINRKTGGYIVAPSHPADTRWGYVFNNTRITSTYFTPEEGKVYLGRPWHNNPKTVFLNTQMELGAYEGYWYETMGGIPALWAVYNIWDKNSNKMSNNSIADYWYWNSDRTEKITGKAKNALTDEEAAQYTLQNVLAGDGTTNAATGKWNPLPIIEKTETPAPVAGDSEAHWPAVDYAICYVVTVNGKPIAFPTEPKIENLHAGDVVMVQAVSENGALSDMSQPVTIATATGINAVGQFSAPSAIYTLGGHRLSAMKHGLNIVRTENGTVRKITMK